MKRFKVQGLSRDYPDTGIHYFCHLFGGIGKTALSCAVFFGSVYRKFMYKLLKINFCEFTP